MKIHYLQEILIKENYLQEIIEKTNCKWIKNKNNSSGYKHIIFLSFCKYPKYKYNDFWFLITTTKGKPQLIKHGLQIELETRKDKTIYLNLKEIHRANLSNSNIKKINNSFYFYKDEIIKKLSNKKIKFLSENTTMDIWKHERKRREN